MSLCHSISPSMVTGMSGSVANLNSDPLNVVNFFKVDVLAGEGKGSELNELPEVGRFDEVGIELTVGQAGIGGRKEGPSVGSSIADDKEDGLFVFDVTVGGDGGFEGFEVLECFEYRGDVGEFAELLFETEGLGNLSCEAECCDIDEHAVVELA